MKKFLIHIVSILAITLVIMAVLDFVYTKVYENAFPRTKFQLFRSLKDSQIDYAFLGSSRVDNAIIPELITKKTGKKAVNLAFSASKLSDIYTIVKLCKAYNIKTEKTFIQVDYIYNLSGNSNLMAYEIMPFLRDNDATKDHFNTFYAGKAYYYIPFYRYCVFDQKIGIREILCNLIGKKTYIVKNQGYNPMFGNAIETEYKLPDAISQNNEVFDSIRKFCNNNHINAVYFCAPFSKETKNLDYIRKLKNKIPELIDYSSAVKDSKMFGNNPHLNDSGAYYFTNIITEDLLQKAK